MNYEKKYIKYKEKYLELKNQTGGEMSDENFFELIILASQCKKEELLDKLNLDNTLINRTIDKYEKGTLLHEACKKGCLELVKELVKRGANVLAKDDLASTGGDALWYASRNNYIEIVKFLIDNGANINSRDLKFTSLGIASYMGHKEICVYLLSHGANLLDTMIGRSIDYPHNSLSLYNTFHVTNKSNRESNQQSRKDLVVTAIEYIQKSQDTDDIKTSKINKINEEATKLKIINL